MISVLGLNVNAFNRGNTGDKRAFFTRLSREQPDVVCLQETNRQLSDFPGFARLDGYETIGLQQSGSLAHNGVAIMARAPFRATGTILCNHASCQGRFIEAAWENLVVASVYAPSPSGSQQKRRSRDQFLTCVTMHMKAVSHRPYILIGDANITLTDADSYDANKTQNSPWMDYHARDILAKMLEKNTWVDSYRRVHGKWKKRTTVWHSETSFPNNGFGIDYQLVSGAISGALLEAGLIIPTTYQLRYSDHAATLGKYAINLT